MSIYVVGAGGRLLCVTCKCTYAPEDMAVDFGSDAWGRRYGAGICRGCALPAANVMSEEDEMSLEVRG